MNGGGDRWTGIDRGSLAARLLAAQAWVIGSMALTMVVTAAIVGPPVFDDHMNRAGHGGQPAVLEHAQTAFTFAGVMSLVIGLGIAGLGALVVSTLLTRRITGSIADLSSAAERVAAGEYDAAPRVPDHAGRELASLAASFTRMSEQLASTEATRRRMLTDLGHEMRTPIAALEVCLEGIEDGVVAADAATLATLRQQTARLARLGQDIRDVSAAEEGRLELCARRCSAAELLARAYRTAREAYARRGVTLTPDTRTAPGAEDVAVAVDPERIAQVLDNLLANALRHTPPGGQVKLTLRPGGQTVAMAVVDTGDGIAADQLPHLFERFYRTDTARDRDHGGTGVGLAISRAIARAHGGDLTATSAGPGRGATFIVRLPRS